MKELDERIRRAVGSRPVRYERRPGGYSTADRFAVELADGRRVFVKSAEAEHMAGWLRREHEVYAALLGQLHPGARRLGRRRRSPAARDRGPERRGLERALGSCPGGRGAHRTR